MTYIVRLSDHYYIEDTEDNYLTTSKRSRATRFRSRSRAVEAATSCGGQVVRIPPRKK